MNWRMRRARLEAAGPADARYDDVTLSFVTADGHAAPNAIVLLRNGGGKSLLLYLLFKALLPRRSDGTKTAEEQRTARPIVLPDECATVAIEWEHRDDGRRLVTGHSFERGDGEESRWLFEPLDGVLTLDSLPLRDDRRRRTRAGLMNALEAEGLAHGALRFRAVSGVRAWEQELLGYGIDPAILRYQARLNRSEGGDDDELRFSTPESFARFVLQMVLEDEPLTQLQQQVQTHADQLGRREALALEAEFCRDVAALLRELAGAHDEVSASDHDHGRARRTQQELAGVLDAATAFGEERLARLTEQREPLDVHRKQLEAAERDLDGEAKVVRARTERLLSDAATEAVRAAATAARAADAELTGWQLVEALTELSKTEAELAELSQRVDRQARGIDDARAERRDAAVALAGALLHAAGGLDARAAALRDELAAAEAGQEELRDEIEQLGRRQGELKERRGTLEAQLDAFARATARLRDEGLLADGERPSAASERVEAEREDLAAQRVDLDERVAAQRVRTGETEERRAAAAAQADEHEAAARSLGRRRDEALVRVSMHLDERVHDTLDVADGWQPLDEPAGAERAMERARAAADGRRATAANAIDARAADERSLERDGLLAVESDVERICEALEDAGIEAFPALRHLAGTVDGERMQAVIAADPGLAAGIVVRGVTPEEALFELAQVHPPRRPLILVSAEEALRAARGARRAGSARAPAVLLPAPGAYDVDAAHADREQLAAALEELRAAYEQHGRLSTQLGRLGATVSGEAEQLRALLPQAAANDRRLLGAVARELSRREELAEAARARAERQQELLREGERKRDELEERRTAVAAQEQRCERALERLSSLDDLDVAAARAEFERLAARIEALATEAEAVRRRRDDAIRGAKGIEDRLATSASEAAALRERAAELPLDGTVAEPAEGSLTALSERLVVAERLLESRISDTELRAELADAERRAARLKGEVERAGADAQRRARELADSPAGIDPQVLARGRREAKESYERALREQGEAATVEGQAAERLYAAKEALSPRDHTREPALLDTLTPDDAAHGAALLERLAELRAARADDVADNARKLQESDARIATEAELLRELRAGRERLAVAPEHTRPPRGASAADADRDAPGSGDLPPWTRRVDRVFEQVSDAVRAVDEATRAHTAARQALHDRVQAIAGVVAAADERIPRGITAPLRGGERLAPEAGRLEAELRTRAGELDRTINELERHRQAILAQLTAVGADGVRKLDKVANATTLPRDPALGAWSGKQFARVKHRVVTDDAERQRELGRVLDAAVAAQGKRRGLDLAFGATMALLQDGLSVSVLKPHPQPDDQYHPIEVVGPEFSGGEELTIKLVLFCAVSAVRTAERAGRARGERRAGPLLIDNPIGTASRESLVDLQLRLARHLDAQFIPFTGLEGELNVTGRFAAAVALTNDKDLLSGMRYVKPVAGAAPLLPPRPDGAAPDAAVVTAISYAPGVDVAELADAARER